MVAGARSRAKEFSLPFNITEQNVEDVWPEGDICPILQVKMNIENGKLSALTPSLDKVVPLLGYVVGNIGVISQAANTAKGNHSDPAVFERIAAYLRTHQ